MRAFSNYSAGFWTKAGKQTNRVQGQSICLGEKSAIANEQPWKIQFYFIASVERRDHRPKELLFCREIENGMNQIKVVFVEDLTVGKQAFHVFDDDSDEDVTKLPILQ